MKPFGENFVCNEPINKILNSILALIPKFLAKKFIHLEQMSLKITIPGTNVFITHVFRTHVFRTNVFRTNIFRTNVF